jgi:hypothetical protein
LHRVPIKWQSVFFAFALPVIVVVLILATR